MKRTPAIQKTAHNTRPTASQTASTGLSGVALAPPAYGMEMADQQPIQAVSEPEPLASVTWPGWIGVMQRKEASPGAQTPQNQTGLPDKLKTGIETLSGLAMDDVRVHYNSAKPAQLQALAYTQGADIHIGPGQERHLPHEAWHVVQQKQGRVRNFFSADVTIVHDYALEAEADRWGQMATSKLTNSKPRSPHLNSRVPDSVIQPKMGMELEIPVPLLTDKYKNVPQKVAYLKGKHYKIEGDASSAAGTVTHPESKEEFYPSIVEVITEPIDEHLPNATAMLGEQLNQIDDLLSKINDLTNALKDYTTVKMLAEALKLEIPQKEYSSYLIGGPTKERRAPLTTSNVHYTVGVGYAQLPALAQWLHETSSEGGEGAKTGKDYRDVFPEIKKYLDISSGYGELSPAEKQAVEGFIYLAFTHARAIDRFYDEQTFTDKGGVSKNYLPALSRVPFHWILEKLPGKSKNYLKTHGEEIKKKLLKNLFEEPEIAKEGEYLQVEGLTAKFKGTTKLAVERKYRSAHKYLSDIFAGETKNQDYYFGGMKTLPVEDVGSALNRTKGIPLELRHLGGRSILSQKEWKETAYHLLAKSQELHGSAEWMLLRDVYTEVIKAKEALKKHSTKYGAVMSIYLDRTAEAFQQEIAVIKSKGNYLDREKDIEKIIRRYHHLFNNLIQGAYQLIKEESTGEGIEPFIGVMVENYPEIARNPHLK